MSSKVYLCLPGSQRAGKTTTIKLLLGLIRPTSGVAESLAWISSATASISAPGSATCLKIPFLRAHDRPPDAGLHSQVLLYWAQAEIDKRVDEMIELVGLQGKPTGRSRAFLAASAAVGNRPGGGQLSRPADPGRTRCQPGPAGTARCARSDVPHPQIRTIFYCTHILDDVQRVSDQVAIVNQGELITQASVEELLIGKGDLIYTVTLRGEPATRASQAPTARSTSSLGFRD